jgi:hypothetical protein
VFFILRASRFSLSLSIVNSLIQHLVISGQIGGFQGEINHFALFQQNIFRIHCLLQRKPSVMLRIDNHVLPSQNYIFSSAFFYILSLAMTAIFEHMEVTECKWLGHDGQALDESEFK